MEFLLAGSVIGAGYLLSKGGKERQIKKTDLIEADPSENNIYESRHLDTTKAKRYDWEPSISIEEGIRNTVKYLLSDEKKRFR